MRKVLILLAVAALVSLPAARASSTTVTISALGFVPASVTVSPNDTVTWTNTDTANHQVVGKKAGFTSPVLQTGQSYSFVFKNAGNFQITDALDKSNKGTIIVQATPPARGSVSISASSLKIVYGRSTTLSGSISNHQSGQRVDVLAQAYGENGYKAITTVTTASDGSWSYAVKTPIQTSYEARWSGATSSALTVGVRPLVTLRVLTGNRFSTKVVAARSFAGKLVQLQRHSSFGQWVTLRQIRLNSSSSAIFRSKLPNGSSTLRTAISVNQAGAGYLGGMSRNIFWHQT